VGTQKTETYLNGEKRVELRSVIIFSLQTCVIYFFIKVKTVQVWIWSVYMLNKIKCRRKEKS